MRKTARIAGTVRFVQLWQLWTLGGNHVITIPSRVAKFAGKDQDDRNWVRIEEGRNSLEFTVRVLTGEDLDGLIMSEEEGETEL